MSSEIPKELDFVLESEGPSVPECGADGAAPSITPASLIPRAPGGDSASPIADLSYRNYEGPLLTRRARWWIVAANTLRLAKAKKGFWIAAAISILPYLFVLLQLYLQSLAGAVPQGANPLDMSETGQKFQFLFFQALKQQGFFLFIIALLVGSGSIALDNRSNALMVYLSKPITKGDYVIGKWMGVFIVLFATALAPSLLLYLYCLLSYVSEGFFKNDPVLVLRIIGAAAMPAAIHSSMILGFSAWSKTPRMAGAIYAGCYFVGDIVASATWAIMSRGNFGEGILVRHLSVGGVITGLEQNILGVNLMMPTYNQAKQAMETIRVTPPSIQVMIALGIVFCAIGIAAARARIRAVEVVKG